MLSNNTVPRLSIDPFSDGFLADPYAHHDLLRGTGPVFWLECHGIYGAARHAEVSAALKDWQNFCSGRGVGLDDFAVEKPWRPPSLLLETDPPVHDRTRSLMNSVVALPGLKALIPLWRTKAEALADRLVAQRHFDAVAELAEAYPLSIFPDTIGMTEEGRENLLVYARAIFNAFGPRNALFTATDRAAGHAVAWTSHACQRNSLKPGGWGMAVYEQADAGNCNAEEAHLLVRSFLSAGVDTTVTGIANMIYAFALHPGQWRMLRGNPSLRRKAFEEALRWDSPVQTFFRTTTRAVELGGTVLPAGAKILLFLAAANRDPRRWDQPERFDISRQASGHVGFGFGIHQCLGQMVARLEAETLLEALLPRVAEIRLAGTPVRRLNNTLHAFFSMPVAINPV
jgi:cytochrome P450